MYRDLLDGKNSQINKKIDQNDNQTGKETDLGRVIGKNGKTANAIRCLVQASSSIHDRVSNSKDTLSSGGKFGNVYLKSYDTGIENGPVDFTGLAMLHGTPSEPEYVLNNDQAYNLLTNLTTKKAETEKIGGDTDKSTNYNVYGDIVLEGVDDPAEFWNAITKSISNRRNVTKNSKKL